MDGRGAYTPRVSRRHAALLVSYFFALTLGAWVLAASLHAAGYRLPVGSTTLERR